MNSGATSERVYDALKHRILNRWYRPGDRLEPAALAESLGSSVTPVRDALHLLSGERLLETRPGTGFHLPQIDEPALEDLYDWSAQVLLLAIRESSGDRSSAIIGTNAAVDTNAANSTASLFERVGSGSGNVEHLHAIRSLNDRLHAIRLVEAGIFHDWYHELTEIDDALDRGDPATLKRRIIAYHRRRYKAAAALVRAVYREDPDG